MPTPLETRNKEIEAKVMQLLANATELKLSLSEDEGAYHYSYVAKKLTECSVAMEKLSDMQMELTKISLEVTRLARDAKYLLKSEIKILQSSQQYQQQPSLGRANFISSRTAAKEKEVEGLTFLSSVVSEVRGAISDRIQTLKRLDSDIRLHSKLLEPGTGGPGGATSPTSYTGSKKSDIEI